MKKTTLPIITTTQPTAIRKAVRAMGAGTLLKPTKPKRLSTLDLKISLKYRR